MITETTYSVEPGNIAYFSTDYKKLINRIHRLAEQYPADIDIIKDDKDNDGVLYCRMPADLWLFGFKHKQKLPEERRKAASERMKAMRAKQLEQTE